MVSVETNGDECIFMIGVIELLSPSVPQSI